MTDKETNAVDVTEMSDDQLAGAAGGSFQKPVTAPQPKRVLGGDPCEGGE